MEPKDTAYEKLNEFLSRITENYWDEITNEAETRKRIIDPIFSDVLAWPESDIHLESQAGTGFIDYRLTVGGLTRLIVEAKQHERELGLSEGYEGRYFKLNGSVFKHEAAREGIEQAIRYCGHKNAELACITNGRQWLVLRGNRLGDGKDTLDGKACCFSSLNAIKDTFSLFYALLSYDAVSDFRFRPIFQEAEGQPSRIRTFRAPARTPETRIFLTADKLHADIDRIMVSFFQDLSGEDDPEARRACFVTTDESSAAEQSLLRISEDLRNSVKSINSEEGKEITEAIKRVHEMKRKELVLLIGTKSAGKSTFIERFFSDVLPQSIADDTVVIRIDFASCEVDASSVIKWLNEHFLEAAEKAAFCDGVPDYNDIEGMYWKEYERWRKGTMRHLYEQDKESFKIEFGKHIERRREERPHEYIVHLLHLLHRIVGGFAKVPCLVFDNADHFGVDFQEEVFKYAYSLHKECICLVLLPITDTTSWEITKEGALQSF
jgi:GTPase SAR1 family protein